MARVFGWLCGRKAWCNLATYGSSRYGSVLYGSESIAPAASAGNVFWKVQVDWDNDGAWGIEIESMYIRNIRFERGRKARLRGDGRGQNHPENERFEVEIYDPSGRYDVFNAGSPLYDRFGAPGLLARIQMVNSTTHASQTVFVGTLTEVNWDYESKVGVLAGTGLSRWMELGAASKVYAPKQIYSNYGWDDVFIQNAGTTPAPINYWRGRTGGLCLDECVGILMDRISWPFGSSVSAVTLRDEPDYFLLRGVSGWETLKEIADGFASRVFFRKDGTLFVMDKSDTDGLAVVDPPSSGALRRSGLERTAPFDSLVNKVSVRLRPHFTPLFTSPLVGADYQQMWSSAGPIEVLPGKKISLLVDFDQGAGKTLQANFLRVNSDSPLEASPLVVNSKPDKSGTNMGAVTGTGETETSLPVDLVGTNSYGWLYCYQPYDRQGQVVVVLSNISSTRTAYFFNLIVYGIGVREVGTPLVYEAQDADSIGLNGVREMDYSNSLLQTVSMAQSVGESLVRAANTRDTASVVTVGYDGRGLDLYSMLATYDVGTVVDFGAAGGAESLKNYGLNGKNLIVGQSFEWLDGSGQNGLVRLSFEKQVVVPRWLAGDSATVTAGSSITKAATCPAADDRLLVVFVGTLSSASVSGITWNGTALTKADAISYSTGTNPRGELWYLAAPATGTANLVVTMSGSTTAAVVFDFYANVDQTTPLGTVAKTSGASGASSLAISAGANDLVVDGFVYSRATNAWADAAAGQLLNRQASADGTWALSTSGRYKTLDGSVTNSWSGQSGPYASVGVAIKVV